LENEELKQLLYDALETELGGVKVYERARHNQKIALLYLLTQA
jgi:hypothetical protein